MFKKTHTTRLFLFYFLILALAFTLRPSSILAFEIAIDVSPNELNIQSNSTIVTVHTDISYDLVAGTTVYFNNEEIHIDWSKSDDRGNFVAKFDSDDIKTLDSRIIDDYNTLVFTGYTIYGEAFIGTQDIMVRDDSPACQNSLRNAKFRNNGHDQPGLSKSRFKSQQNIK